MRVFKIGLGVLALMLGVAGSMKAESMPDKDIVGNSENVRTLGACFGKALRTNN